MPLSDEYYQQLYQRLIELTSKPGPASADQKIEEAVIIYELRKKSYHFADAS